MTGAGWTDVRVRLSAYGVVLVAAAVIGIALLVPAVTRRLHRRAAGENVLQDLLRAIGGPLAVLLAAWFVVVAAVPAVVQWLVVQPNEITMEEPYIAHNIEFTRKGFQLDEIEERRFPASEQFTEKIARENQDLLAQIRLWDPRALVDVYKQFQEIRLYYEFADVDIDRYTIDGDYRQVMVLPREIQLENLPGQSQTFINRHFKYTHGYGWSLGGTRLFLSSYPTADSRILFHRQIRERAKTLAPFLHFDRDPYVVLADGRLYWIIDAYTTSAHYPYSEPFSRRMGDVDGAAPLSTMGNEPGYLVGKNYVCNAVKTVVDAYEGTVDFYIFEPDDPIIQVWQRVFPGLLKPKDDMPENLLRHVRYPEGLLLTQGLVYAKYHMTDPTVFYNQEDLWVRATEKYYARVQPVEPYYVMWRPPESGDVEFVQILPFTPKNRQVMIGWIAGMCDPGNYGRLLAYRFPKEKRILGPQQVETKIDQDSYLSGQLTLWDQRGSSLEQLAAEANEAFERYLQATAEQRFADAAQAMEDLSRALNQLEGQSADQPGKAASRGVGKQRS